MAVRLDRLSRFGRRLRRTLARARERQLAFCASVARTSIPRMPPASSRPYVLAAASEYERDLTIRCTRTRNERNGHSASRRASIWAGPSSSSQAVIARVVRERLEGATLRRIADGLTEDAVPSARGGAVWRASTVQGLLSSLTGQRILGEASEGHPCDLIPMCQSASSCWRKPARSLFLVSSADEPACLPSAGSTTVPLGLYPDYIGATEKFGLCAGPTKFQHVRQLPHPWGDHGRG